MRAWLAHHLHSLATAMRQFGETPLSTLFTILVIGVAVALPAGLYLLLTNLDRAADGVKPQAELTLFLKLDIDATAGRALAERIGQEADVAEVRFIDRADGIARLEAAGLADIAAGLPENPLPHTLVIKPREETVTAMEALGARLQVLPESERVLLDSDWIKRLTALMQLGRDLIFMLAVILGLALAAITANTIRLQIYAKRDEIEVARLIGATDRFIRRPYLYFGGIQGLAGGLSGWLLVMIGLGLLGDSVSQTATAYGVEFSLQALGLSELIALLSLSASLGWLGAFLSVTHTLREVETF